MKITNVQGTVPLNNGVEMPCFGLDVFLSEEEAEDIAAIDAFDRMRKCDPTRIVLIYILT